MEEIWKDIKNYEGFYQVSNLGNVRSLDRYVNYKKIGKQYIKGKNLKPNNVSGYYQVLLMNNGKKAYKKVHRLVAETFIPNPDNKPQVNHIDGNKLNNNVENLEWNTVSENILHSFYVLKNHIKKVYRYTKSGEYIDCYPTIKEAGEKLNVRVEDISKCCHHKRKSAGGYMWSFEKEEIL